MATSTATGRHEQRAKKLVNSGDIGDHAELNMTEALPSAPALFRTTVTVNGKRLTALIDSGASGNFISKRATIEEGLAT